MTLKKAFATLPLILLLLVDPGQARMMFSADEPDSGLPGNSFVDILYADGVLWLATGQGLSFSEDLGQSWYTYTSENGLSADEPSAMFARPGEMWVALSHFEEFQGINYPFGDGFDVTYDTGDNWISITPTEAAGYANLVYDIDGNAQSTYAACFHGGLIVSHDDGSSWRHLYYSIADSSDYVADEWADLNTGRYYSCLVDEHHADTLVVYGGSAAGIVKYLHVPRRVKFGGNNVTALAGTDDFMYIAHENGISQADTTLEIYFSSGTGNGLPSTWTRRMIVEGDRLWAALFDPADSSGLGLYYTEQVNTPWTEFAATIAGPADFWQKLDTNLFDGPGAGVYDFKAYGDAPTVAFYVAAGDSGVFRSDDDGLTWNRFYVDSTDTDQTSLRNHVLSIDVTADTMYLGTRAGLVKAAYVEPFEILFDTMLTFPDSDTSGAVVSVVRRNQGDMIFTWVGVEPSDPASEVGNYAAIQIEDSGNIGIAAIYSNEGTQINDIVVTDSFTTFATSTGLIGNYNTNRPVLLNFVFTVLDDSTGQTLGAFDYNTTGWYQGKLFAGAASGFGYRRRNIDWHVERANTDPLKHDLSILRNRLNSSLPGDWVVAMEMQERGVDTLLWAACRRVPDTATQYNAVAYSTDFGDSWTQVLTNEQVWNFAFDVNGVAYAAASGGLFYAPTGPDSWQRATIVDPVTQDTISSETEVFAVEVADTILWVGTSSGLASRHIENIDDWNILRVFKAIESADDVYAAPVPFSPVNSNGRLTLHYRVEQDAEITVEIYDFAMNHVKTVAESKFRSGGNDYYETWDGYNGDGEMVATGMYYFKVVYSTGELRWGRLAIIP